MSLNAVSRCCQYDRFADDPKLLAVEWEDGVPPSQFVTPARDAVLAALLGAAQAAAGRPIAVMPGEPASLLHCLWVGPPLSCR
jgi:hypothetical protein